MTSCTRCSAASPWRSGWFLLLTLVLLTRAFRSVVLARQGGRVESPLARRDLRDRRLHLPTRSRLVISGASAATRSITAYIPVMIFAFLFGLSMDYEVFMISRMREAYDETGSTNKAIELGLARTGKLVTSGALILMFAFLVLSSTARIRGQVTRHRHRRWNHLRRHRHTRLARTGPDEATRRLELVDAPLDGNRPTRPAP